MRFARYVPVLLVLLALSVPAYAAPVTLTTAQITGFTFNAGASTAGSTGSVAPVGSGAAFSVDFATDAGGTGVFDSAAALGVIANAGDNFVLDIMNSDANPWAWTVELFDAANASLGSDTVSPLAGATDTINILVGGGAGGTIDHIQLSVNGTFNNDINADSNVFPAVFPAPEPTVLLLLGTALLGLPLIGRFRAK